MRGNKTGESVEGLAADVLLQPLGVAPCGFDIDAECEQESFNHTMAFPAAQRQRHVGGQRGVAMATDLAEFLGGAIGLALLFRLPLIAGMAVTAVVTYGLLMFDRRGYRPMELIIGGLVAIIAVCYLTELLIAPVDWRDAARHTFLPNLPDSGC